MGLATITWVKLQNYISSAFPSLSPGSVGLRNPNGSTAVHGVEAPSKADVPAVCIPQVCTVPSVGRRWSCAAVGLTQGWGRCFQCVMVPSWTPSHGAGPQLRCSGLQGWQLCCVDGELGFPCLPARAFAVAG